MLLRFRVENWMSFKREIEFSMVASRERQHGHRLPRSKRYSLRILPISAVYGGNASGKTNLFKALNFAKLCIVKGNYPDSVIPVEPYKLDTSCAKKPSRFCFELLVHDSVYEFSFSVTRNRIKEERLIQILNSREITLYHRRNGRMEFCQKLAKDKFLQFAFKGTRENQLFLTNSVNQKVENFEHIYNWFKNDLELIAPDSRFAQFEQYIQEQHDLCNATATLLSKLDTGISHIGGEEIPFSSISLPEEIKTAIRQDAKKNTTIRLRLEPGNEHILISAKDGELVAKKLYTYHQCKDGNEAKFEMNQESDGSQRIIDLLPVFVDILKPRSTKTYVIDELDRSLHTLVTQKLLEIYLSKCSPTTRCQLLFTTHDVLLMNQKLLRRDEMWVCERDIKGASSMFSFSEYDGIRYDKDIRKSYLSGRLGGVPNILIDSDGLCINSHEKDERWADLGVASSDV